jgi:hypothetical protein
MRVRLTEDSIEVLLASWEKVLGLMKDIRVPLSDVGDVRVVEHPLREAAGTGVKAGLRLPGFRYVARTIRLDQAFAVKRGVPALSFSVRNHAPLERVLVSTPEAKQLAKRLQANGRRRDVTPGDIGVDRPRE